MTRVAIEPVVPATEELASCPVESHGETGALVLEGNHIALGVVRSLGRRGIPVWVVHGDQRIATFSKYAQRHLAWTSDDEEGRRDFLLDLAWRHGLRGWALFPANDEGVGLVARHHEALQGMFCLTTASWNDLSWAYDKRLTYRLACRLGIDHPQTFYPQNRMELAQLECPFPVILKPAIKEEHNPFTDAKAWRVEDRESLLERYDEASSLVDPKLIMVQELIHPGEPQYSYAALSRDGQAIAWVVSRHLRQFPLDFGRFSTYAETVEQPEVERDGRRLLAETRYTGLVQIQFKQDSRRGTFKLLDVNVRAWGSHTLGQAAGVDFPYLAWRMFRGEPVEDVKGRVGVRWARMVTDVPAAAMEIRRGTLSLVDYLRSLGHPIHLATFSRDDPIPATVEPVLLARGVVKRGRL